MSTPAITYLRLDEDYDIVFSPAAAYTNGAAVTQAILTTLKLFLGEWWENLALGLPVFQGILGRPASQAGQAAMQQLIIGQIQTVPYVVNVNSVVTGFTDGQFTFTANVLTTFGVVTVSNLPGQAASLANS